MSWWTDVRDTVETVVGDAAPIVLTALGGPAGAAVGGMIADSLGVAKPKLKDALIADPAAAEKIKALELSKGLEIAKLDSQARLAQINLDKREVRYGLFGQWEDALGWVCALIFGEAFLLLPTARAIASFAHVSLKGWPVYDLHTILSVLGLLLGAGGVKLMRAKYGK